MLRLTKRARRRRLPLLPLTLIEPSPIELVSSSEQTRVGARPIPMVVTFSVNTPALQKKTTSSKTTRSHPTKENKSATTRPEGSHTGHHESGHETKPSDDTSSFVFPHEPFNPSPPPEPTPPGNN